MEKSGKKNVSSTKLISVRSSEVINPLTTFSNFFRQKNVGIIFSLLILWLFSLLFSSFVYSKGHLVSNKSNFIVYCVYSWSFILGIIIISTFFL